MTLDDYDELDKRIIKLLCKSSQGSYRQIAKQLNVHPTTLIQRIKNLESKGVIKGYRASIDYMAMGFEFMGTISIYSDDINTAQHDICAIPQVVSFFEVTGESDAMVWVACVDRAEFSDVVNAINAIPTVRRTSTQVVLNIAKDPYAYIPPILEESETGDMAEPQ